MCSMWASTVRLEMTSCSAICRFDSPSATSPAISHSRPVSPAPAVAGPATAPPAAATAPAAPARAAAEAVPRPRATARGASQVACLPPPRRAAPRPAQAAVAPGQALLPPARRHVQRAGLGVERDQHAGVAGRQRALLSPDPGRGRLVVAPGEGERRAEVQEPAGAGADVLQLLDHPDPLLQAGQPVAEVSLPAGQVAGVDHRLP